MLGALNYGQARNPLLMIDPEKRRPGFQPNRGKKRPKPPVDPLGPAARAAIAAKNEPVKRNLANLISLDMLKALTSLEMDIISLKLAGQTNKATANKLGCDIRTLVKLLKGPAVQTAMAQATLNLKMGLLTAADVAQATEAEVLTTFYKLAMNADTPLEWRYKFGTKILDHRLDTMKAVGSLLPREGLPKANQVEVIEIEAHVKERMSAALQTLEATPDPPPIELEPEGEPLSD